ncbi:FecR family protein [Noviherbaspirillum sp. ST9]|uniref:FecR family protein n=1 Tax=Noviherbaspirillum sp. ST9 TaxID=3401606 RepID=UPI003B5898A6
MPHSKKIAASWLLASLAAIPLQTLAEDLPAGMVKRTKGTAHVERDGRKTAAQPGDKLFSKDRIITAADGSVGITLRDDTMLSVGPNSTMSLDKFAFDSTTHQGTLQATVKRGTLGVISGKLSKQSPNAVQFNTPSAILGVRGTEFVIDAGEGGE